MTRNILLLSLICSTSAFAIPVDPAPNHIGVYFDTAATISSYQSVPNVPFFAYVIITNPSTTTIAGLEVGYRLVTPPGYENSYARLSHGLASQALSIGNSGDPAQGDYIIGLATPLPQSEAMVFATWELVLTDDFPLDIYLGPATRQSVDDGLPAYTDGVDIVTLGLPSGGASLPVATINGGVSTVPGRDLQAKVVLEQCQPNPFNPRTTIGYSLASEGPVTMLVNDLAGRVVRVLMRNEVMSAGRHEVTWDGLDSRGGEVGSGVYFCRIEAWGVSKTTRMTLVR